MKVFIGICLLAANLLAALGDGTVLPLPGEDCNYFCPIIGIYPVCGTDGNTYPSQCHLDCWSKKVIQNGQAAIKQKTAGRCPEARCLCPAYYNPVCGTDERTYSNACLLDCENKRLMRYGLPPIFVKSNSSRCSDDGCDCAEILQPVCGTDGRTYSNGCLLGCASKKQQQIGRPPIFISSYGPCPRLYCNCPLFSAPVCGSDGRSYRNICFLECASKISQKGGPIIMIRSYGMCPFESCNCPANVDPVCTSNGNTYSNICQLRCQNGRRFALGQPPLKILYNGPCKDCVCPLNYAPVCGSDRRTYPNLCELNCENKRRAHLNLRPLLFTDGECGCFCTNLLEPVCASDFKTYRNVCLLGCENRRRVHAGLAPLFVTQQGECSCTCNGFYQPVCGSDMRTYSNICWYNCTNFNLIRHGRPPLFIVKNGRC